MNCRVCNKDTMELLIDFGSNPIVHQLNKSLEQKNENYPFRLGHCLSCGFMGLLECIDSEILYENYHARGSWKLQAHVPRLVDVMTSLIGRNLDHTILDIGCNDGNFLDTLKEFGYKKLHGVEPTLDTSKIAISKGYDTYQGFFGRESAKNIYAEKSFDIVITRHVLEHIKDLDDFLEGITLVVKKTGCLVIELPNSEWCLDYLDYSLWEEHINYFTLNSLQTLLRKHSFEIIHYETTLYSGKALTVFCKKTSSSNTSISLDKKEVSKILKYKESWDNYNYKLREFLDSLSSPIAIYGCGARSCNFVNFTGIGNYIDSFIDDQKEKQDLYVPGNNLRINKWDKQYYQDFIFLLGVNTENEYKVIQKKEIPLDRFYSICPPSFNLPNFWQDMITHANKN